MFISKLRASLLPGSTSGIRLWPALLPGLFTLLMLSLAASGQTVTGTITGTVVDPNGSVIAGANVTLAHDQTNDKRDQPTNDSGRFSFASVQPGVYSLRIEHQGFETLLRTRVVLSANENLALGDLSLKTGQVSETVTVTSEGQIVEKESSDLTARLTSDQLSLISTKGRDVTSLLRLIPGTSNIPDIEAVGNGFGTTLPTFSGQRTRSTVATVDGLNASEPSGSNLLSMTTSIDAISEVKVLRDNYAAEYGNNGGAMINLVTKSGGKDYRGTAYYFIRNEALNANNFFSNKAGLKRPLYRFNYWGFNFGGPMPLLRFGEGAPSLVKNKAFFFVNVEKPHTITPTDPVFVTVPTALERIGDFSQSINSSGAKPVVLDPLTGLQFPNNAIPGSRINKSMQNVLNYYPLPNSPIATNPGRYVFQRSVDVPKSSYLFRLDFKPTSKDSFSYKAQWWTSDNEGTATSGWPNGSNGVDRWGIRSHYLYKDNGWPGSASWVHLFSASVVNEFNIGMRHDSEGFIPTTGFAEALSRAAINYTAPQLFPQNNTKLNLIPIFNGWISVAGNPANINWLNRWGEVGEDFIKPSFADNVSYTHGNHSYKFGAYFERLLNREAPGGNWSGTIDFGTGTGNGFTTAAGNTNFAYANAILGNFNSYTEQLARPFTNEELKLFQWYGQDQWRVSRKLTINYGMRFEAHSGQFQLDSQGSNFDPAKFDPAKAPLLYVGYCLGQPGGVPPLGTTCSAANSFAADPRIANPTAAQLLNKNLVRAIIPGTGDLLNGLELPGDPNTPTGYRHTRTIDFEPRVGFAWDLFGKGKTVLRGMAGTYHMPRIGGGTGGASSLGNNPPEQRTFQILNGNIDNLTNLTNTAALFPVAISALEVNSKTPSTYNYSIGIQQDVGFKTVIEASYVGAFGRHLGERRNINSIPDGAKFVDCRVIPANLCHPENRDPLSSAAASAKNNDFLRPYRGYGDITRVTWDGTSNYNSLQVQVNRRYTHGFQYGLAYTYSKSFDYANDDTSDLSLPRPYKNFNYATSDFDQTHILTIGYIYDVPALSRHWKNGLTRAVFDNWQLSGTTSYATGRPKNNISASYTAGTATITAGQTCPAGTFQTSSTVCTMITDFTGGTVNARANMICDPTKNVSGADATGLAYAINVGCFTNPTALGQIGNMPRNPVRIPATFNNDLALFKNIPIGEKRQVQLRWEIYNIFNHPNFDDIDGSLTFGIAQVNPNPSQACTVAGNTCTAVIRMTRNTFGTPTTARTPRVMQGSIRINF
jgi:Carboxypeptidase regulatory-like domain/TonB-dependent Receptor Plug Domain